MNAYIVSAITSTSPDQGVSQNYSRMVRRLFIEHYLEAYPGIWADALDNRRPSEKVKVFSSFLSSVLTALTGWEKKKWHGELKIQQIRRRGRGE